MFVLAGSLAAACGGGPTSPAPPVAVTLQRVTITGLPEAFAVEEKAQLAASATYSDGRTETVTSRVTWSATSSACSIGTGGLLSAVAEGDCGVEAALDGVKAAASVMVGPSKFFTISGVVRERFGPGSPGIPGSVTIINGEQAGRRVATNADGTFSIPGVPRATLQLRAEAGGFESNTTDVAPASPSAQFMLEPEMAVVERRFVPLPSWDEAMYQTLEMRVTVTHRGVLTLRLSSNQQHCEISYASVFYAQVYKPDRNGIRPLDVAVCPPGPSVEERTLLLDPGSYTIYVGVMNSLSGSASPYRDVYLRYPR